MAPVLPARLSAFVHGTERRREDDLVERQCQGGDSMANIAYRAAEQRSYISRVGNRWM
jgi:hypothetical protein